MDVTLSEHQGQEKLLVTLRSHSCGNLLQPSGPGTCHFNSVALRPEARNSTLALPEEAEASATQVVGRLAFTVWPLSHVALCIASCMAVCQWRKLCHMTVPLLEESPGSVVLLVEQNAS